MGGWGSNRWGVYSRRRCVSESLILDVAEFFRTKPGAPLKVNWVNGNCIQLLRGVGCIHVYYESKKDNTAVDESWPIIQHTSGRWYWKCPGCDRRAGKLYKPYNEILFRCRICHNLTYKSVQERRKYQSLAKLLAAGTGRPVNQFERFLTSWAKHRT